MTIQLQLPPDLEAFARGKAASAYSGDVVAYIHSLLAQEYERSLGEPGEREAVERALLEAIHDEEDTISPEYWEALRREGRQLAAKPGKQ